MTATVSSKTFEVGTLGWRVEDLEDPAIARQWFEGRYEIIEGALISMAAALARGGEPNGNLLTLIRQHLWELDAKASVIPEADLVLSDQRVLRSDIAVMLEADLRAQMAVLSDGADWREHRITVPPTLIVETLSAGHESHDRDLKRRWYADFGVPYYWMVDPTQRTLEALKLADGVYVEVARGAGSETVHAEPFAELAIPLGRVWGEA